MAVPPQSEEMLYMAHPVVRVVKGHLPLLEWQGSQANTVRALIIGEPARGLVTECQYGDVRCCPEGRVSRPPHVQCEVEQIEEVFQKAGFHPHAVHSRPKGNSRSAWPLLLTRETWDVIHFAGHGLTWHENARSCQCLLVSEGGGVLRAPVARAMGSNELGSLLSGGSVYGLIFFSCCESGSGPLCLEVARRRQGEVIGFLYDVECQSARQIAVAFYSELAALKWRGEGLVARAMWAVRLQFQVGTVEEQRAVQGCCVWIGGV